VRPIPWPPALLALSLLLAGCLAAPPQGLDVEPAVEPAAAAPSLTREALAFENFTATLLSLPVVGGEQRFAYEVAEGARWMGAALKWSSRSAELALEALDPQGQPQGASRPEPDGNPGGPRRLDWWVADPAPGAWTFVVRGSAALQEPLALQVHTAAGIEGRMHLAEAASVADGTFLELNLEMRRNESFLYRWASSAPLDFNLHTHRDGETQYPVEETADAMEGTWVADEDGGYSLMWSLGDFTPGGVGSSGERVDLWYRVDGAYDLHSAVG
jgi:hypothetical protein